jgi:hypothetical protein
VTDLYFDSEPLLGWRAWTVAETEDGLELRSLVYAHAWPVGEPMRRVCEPGGCLAARWPDQPHACGIHAFKERTDAELYPATWEARRSGGSRSPDVYAIGRVSLWGRVVEHERGYRAELAYPFDLFVAARQRRLAIPLAARYGVEVMIAEPLLRAA